jgi:glycosyltransferase involved in cell wall biosynthesis
VELSVIIAARNEAGVIRSQLEAVLAQACPVPFEVLVADNGSTDGTAAVVRSLAAGDPRLRLVDAAAVKGSSHAHNVAAAAARGGHLVYTDADDLVAPGWLAALHRGLQATGFAAARLDHERLNPAWTVPWRGIDQTQGLVHRGGGPPWPCAYGTSLAIRRDLHDAVGGWDEELPACADMDFCFRVQRDTGAQLVFVPDAVVHYRHRTTARATLRQAMSYGQGDMRVQERHADSWREPLVALSLPHLIARNARRWLMPDHPGGRRWNPVRRRADLGRWLWDLGADLGRRRGRAELSS